MRWMLGALAILAILGVAAYALLVPPTGGVGWRLDDSTPVHMPAVTTERGVTLYSSADGDPLLVVVVFDSSSCPPRVRAVDIGGDQVDIAVGRDPLWFGGCSADAAPHFFKVRVDSDRVSWPLTVVVHHNDLEPWVTVLDPG